MIQYAIAFPEPHTHLYHVTLTIETPAPTLDLHLPVWTPGSYMVRDYARHVERFAASTGGHDCTWEKTDKSTWCVTCTTPETLIITYQVYAFDLTVRTSHLDATHAYFNPATLCMYTPALMHTPHRMTIQAPDAWQVTTGLARATDGAFVAQDYDELVDSPFEIGTHRLFTFTVHDIPHEIALWGTGNEDPARIVRDTERVVETAATMFGGLPYTRYVFLLHLVDGAYGGLEHRNSVTNIVDRWSFRSARGYERFIALMSHEFFHVWNVKRIRPQPLGPFDYQRENYTRELWAMEGMTSYYDNLILLRAGLTTREHYLEWLADDILKQEALPGRSIQNLETSSFDAWIKYYRQDENSANSSVSYYLKGSLVALLLDLGIRAQTAGTYSLDDVLRRLYAQVTTTNAGYDESSAIRQIVEQITEHDWGAFFADYVRGTAELDYRSALASVGLGMAWGHARTSAEGAPAWHGLTLRGEYGHSKVLAVRRDGPGIAAGIYAGDEIIAIDGTRADEYRLNERVAERRPGDTVVLSVFRRDMLLHIPLTLAVAPPDTLRLLPDPAATPEQIARRQEWLGGTG